MFQLWYKSGAYRAGRVLKAKEFLSQQSVVIATYCKPEMFASHYINFIILKVKGHHNYAYTKYFSPAPTLDYLLMAISS